MGFIMDLVFYNSHIIHYHMKPLWSVAPRQSSFVCPDYLVVCCWIQTTLLHPTIFLQLELNGFLIAQLHILFLKHHFRIISLSVDSMYISSVKYLSASVLPQPPASRACILHALTWSEFFWPAIRLTVWHVCILCPCLILQTGCCGLPTPASSCCGYTECLELLLSAIYQLLLLCYMYG